MTVAPLRMIQPGAREPATHSNYMLIWRVLRVLPTHPVSCCQLADRSMEWKPRETIPIQFRYSLHVARSRRHGLYYGGSWRICRPNPRTCLIEPRNRRSDGKSCGEGVLHIPLQGWLCFVAPSSFQDLEKSRHAQYRSRFYQIRRWSRKCNVNSVTIMVEYNVITTLLQWMGSLLQVWWSARKPLNVSKLHQPVYDAYPKSDWIKKQVRKLPVKWRSQGLHTPSLSSSLGTFESIISKAQLKDFGYCSPHFPLSSTSYG